LTIDDDDGREYWDYSRGLGFKKKRKKEEIGDCA
jgi:hypothetical protein